MNEVQEKFLAKNILLLEGPIEPPRMEYMKEALAKLYLKGAPDITLLISSAGGEVPVGLDIFDALSLYPGKKTAIVTVYARSMAAIVLQACDRRLATQHADIMIHHVSRRQVSLDVLRDRKKTLNLRAEMEKSQKKIYDILAKRTGKTIVEIREACKKEQDMSVDEAIAFGLIDSVNTEPLPK